MINHRNKVQRIILFLFIYLSYTYANAAQIINNNLIEFSLSVQNEETHFKFPLNKYNVKFDQVGISWYEPFSTYFHGGLELGYIDMSQIENPLTSAQFSSGQYAGLLLRFIPVNNSYLSLMLNLNYRYNKTEGKSATQNTEFAWHQTVFSSEIQFHVSNQISLLLAAEYQHLNGEQRDSGSITQLTPFSEAEQLGYRIGLNFMPYRTGIIGIQWSSGFRDGAQVYFKRRF